MSELRCLWPGTNEEAFTMAARARGVQTGREHLGPGCLEFRRVHVQQLRRSNTVTNEDRSVTQ
eukprot:8319868-Alexandrium_andersonii.AAC.1